ncbi:hypothetical protein RU07_02360 [Agrobacterium tumefaciens]|uniref:Uncharacterized protein n=1 Tax=Agrobacterium tumefaciens TaxID=358 RepID=A0A0D0KYG2_AGRTU|nr:hypothetical protein RU07_02360 [Agrobacterium tumefaciens]
MIVAEQKKREFKDKQAYEALDVKQQTYSSWKRGVVPRPGMYPSIAAFLGVDESVVAELAQQAAQVENANKLSAFVTARVYGTMSDRKEGKWKFQPINDGRKRIPEGRYALIVDTKIMEPVFRVGTKIWLDPSRWPQQGDDVIVHTGGMGWIGTFDSLEGKKASLTRYGGGSLSVDNVEAIHVIVLSERVVWS